ncbi:hypothetical protein JOH50_000614 [Rhizobium leguminosarum]|nr:hypothetical protein [Rhizobium leguminosarum]
MTIYDELRKAPFNLDDAAISWLHDTYASLDLDDKIGQLFTLIMIGTVRRISNALLHSGRAA